MDQCQDCGGYGGLGTCLCDYDDILREGLGLFESETQVNQICHFCGVDLFLPAKVNIRMCISCGLGLNHKDCYKCVVCNESWLINGEGSVCVFCKSL